ncbi:MAG: DHHA1 domain-containing protein, partial [Candidatus Omnitrophota bacterium]|nr:DHHA1 domain-containing protein [Candidatus Omnitrophota bacterium]
LFGEKYGDLVRMVSVGSYSKELCGGTHVNKTGEIQIFKIISESSIASGVRRIEAVTADMACREIKQKVDSLKEISNELNTSPEEVLQKIKDLTDKIRELEKGFNATSDRLVNSISDDLLNNVKDINGKETVISEVKNVDAALLRKVSDLIKRRFKKGIFMLLSEYEGKIFMVVGICGDKNISAVKMLNDIGKDFNIKGGGRPDFAQAGGRSGIESKKILEKAKEIIGAL